MLAGKFNECVSVNTCLSVRIHVWTVNGDRKTITLPENGKLLARSAWPLFIDFWGCSCIVKDGWRGCVPFSVF
jgi:hypothetical protein